MSKQLFILLLLSLFLLAACELKTSFKPIETTEDVYTFGPDKKFRINIYREDSAKIRVSFSVSQVKEDLHIDTLSITLSNSSNQLYSLTGIHPYNGTQANSIQYNNFAQIPDSLLNFNTSLVTYFTYDHIYAVKNPNGNKTYIITINAIISSKHEQKVIRETIHFKRRKKLKLLRLVC